MCCVRVRAAVRTVALLFFIGGMPTSMSAHGKVIVAGELQANGDGDQRIVIASRNAKQSASMLELARQYMASRPDVFHVQNLFTDGDELANNKKTISAIAIGALQQMKTGPDWNENNPEWRRMQVLAEQDLSELFTQLQADPKLQADAKQVEAVFAYGLAARLSEDKLKELYQYYSAAPQKNFSDIRSRMLVEIDSGIALMRLRVGDGNSVSPTQDAPDMREASQMFGLFDETIKIRWAVLDPGERGDRSGLQAIPIVFGMGMRLNYAKVQALWMSIPEQTRLDIFSWRETALAKMEREAIYESAKEIRVVVGVPEDAKRVTQALMQLEKKWQAQLKAKSQ